jgi:multiple sugar transport system substrate-binding protein
MMAAFEKKTGKTVELTFPSADVLPGKLQSAVDAGEPPDSAFGTTINNLVPRWAREGRLVGLSAALGPLAEAIDKDALAGATLPGGADGREGLYAMPLVRYTNHVHVWRSLLERAGFTLADIPKGWGPFWAFWCDKVQPAVRKATGRDDIFGIGLAMSPDANDTVDGLAQFADALTRDWPEPWGTSLAEDPGAQATLVEALRQYTAVYEKGCTPPQSVTWTNRGNNEAFLAQSVVMTINETLSIPGAIRRERPADYLANAATIEWPSDAYGRPLHLEGNLQGGPVFAAGRHVEVALEFVRFLVRDGWLGLWPSFAGDRYLPVLATLTDQPFWMDPGDPHRMSAVIQVATHPNVYSYWGLPDAQGRFRDDYISAMTTAVHRIAVDGLTPEQAAAEVIARVKQYPRE